MNSNEPVRLLNAMNTLFKIAGIATWVIGAQLLTIGVTLANPELPINTGASDQTVLNLLLSAANLDQQSDALSSVSGYTPPNTGGPARTGDTGTR
jgi:fucose permease